MSHVHTWSPSAWQVHPPWSRLGAHLAPQYVQGPLALPCLLLLTLHANSPFWTHMHIDHLCLDQR